MKPLICTLLFLMFALFGYGQKASQFNSWIYYYGKHKIGDKVKAQTMYCYCRNDFVKYWQQSLLRTGLHYDLHKYVELGAGYDWIILFPYGEQPVKQKRIEHRVFEHLVIKHSIAEFNISHTYRIEQRFFPARRSQRARYQFTVKYPLMKKEGGLTGMDLRLSNEVLLNIGKSNNGQYFGQNRFWLSLNFPFTNGLSVSPGYMNQYIVKGSGQVENNHTLMMGVVYGFDFRR